MYFLKICIPLINIINAYEGCASGYGIFICGIRPDQIVPQLQHGIINIIIIFRFKIYGGCNKLRRSLSVFRIGFFKNTVLAAVALCHIFLGNQEKFFFRNGRIRNLKALLVLCNKLNIDVSVRTEGYHGIIEVQLYIWIPVLIIEYIHLCPGGTLVFKEPHLDIFFFQQLLCPFRIGLDDNGPVFIGRELI